MHRTKQNWKTAFRNFYYENADPPDDINLDPSKTALLVIDIQNTYLELPEIESPPEEQGLDGRISPRKLRNATF